MVTTLLYIVLFSGPRQPVATGLPHWSDTFRRSARHDCVDPRRRHRAHPIRRPVVGSTIHLVTGLTFFDSRRRAFRSEQLRAGISRTPSIAPRRQKNPRVSVQSRGRVGLFRAFCRDNLIFSVLRMRRCYSFYHRATSFDKATKLANCRSQATHANAWIVLSSRAWDRASRQSPPRVGHRDWSRVCAGSYSSQRESAAVYGHSGPESSGHGKKGRCASHN